MRALYLNDHSGCAAGCSLRTIFRGKTCRWTSETYSKRRRRSGDAHKQRPGAVRTQLERDLRRRGSGRRGTAGDGPASQRPGLQKRHRRPHTPNSAARSESGGGLRPARSTAQRLTNEVAQGLVIEAQQLMQETQDENLRDCAINAAVIKFEHFEMGPYRGLVTAAQQMGQDEIVSLLQQNLQQEEQTAQTAEQSAPQLLQKVM